MNFSEITIFDVMDCIYDMDYKLEGVKISEASNYIYTYLIGADDKYKQHIERITVDLMRKHGIYCDDSGLDKKNAHLILKLFVEYIGWVYDRLGMLARYPLERLKVSLMSARYGYFRVKNLLERTHVIDEHISDVLEKYFKQKEEGGIS